MRWLSRHWQPIVIVPSFAAVVASAGYLMWRLLTISYGGTDTAAKVTVGALALIGVLTTATVSFIGLLLKQSIDRRTLEVSQTEQLRLQLEAAVEAVKLINAEKDEREAKTSASKVQASAALLVLAKLGEVSLAVDLAAELWPAEQVTSTAAVRVIDYALAHDANVPAEYKSQLQRSAVLLLRNNVRQLDLAEDQYTWPYQLDHWPKPKELDAEARYTVALALADWVEHRNRQSKPPRKFMVELLTEAQERDPDQKVKKEAIAAIDY
jgi:hypothetical protein